VSEGKLSAIEDARRILEAGGSDVDVQDEELDVGGLADDALVYHKDRRPYLYGDKHLNARQYRDLRAWVKAEEAKLSEYFETIDRLRKEPDGEAKVKAHDRQMRKEALQSTLVYDPNLPTTISDYDGTVILPVRARSTEEFLAFISRIVAPLAAPFTKKAEEWPEPQPLVSDVTGTPYPLGALPAGIRRAVEEVRDYVKCPASLPALSALSALSLAAQAHINVACDSRLRAGPGSFRGSWLLGRGLRKVRATTLPRRKIGRP
jgi:hypothetical protein